MNQWRLETGSKAVHHVFAIRRQGCPAAQGALSQTDKPCRSEGHMFHHLAPAKCSTVSATLKPRSPRCSMTEYKGLAARQASTVTAQRAEA